MATIQAEAATAHRDADARSMLAKRMVEDLRALPPDIRRLFMAELDPKDLRHVFAASNTYFDTPYFLWEDAPSAFVEDILGETIWSKQREVLDALVLPDVKRVIVPAGFGVGKTHLAGKAVCWFSCVHPVGTATTVTTATRMRQVLRQLWPHVRKTVARAGLPGECDMVQWKMPDRLGVETVVAYGFTAMEHDEASMQGIHCLSADHEVLTDEGWKFLPAVRGDEQVLQLRGDTAEWGPITEVINEPFDGHLNVHDGPNARLSFAVTDNHRFMASSMHYRKTDMVLCRYCDRHIGAKGIARHHGTHERAGDYPVRGTVERVGTPVRRWALTEYRHLPQEFFVRRTNTWTGGNTDTITFPAPPRRPGRSSQHLVERTFTFTQWATFLGWYVSEGSSGDGNGNRVTVSQSQGVKYEQIVTLLTEMGFTVSRAQHGVQFTSEPVAEWLREHCGRGSENKRVPVSIREASPEVIRVFLDAFRAGDGCYHTHPSSARYVTSSRLLADDLQEMLVKIGSARKLRLMQPAGSVGVNPLGQEFVRRHDTWMLNEAGRPSDSNVDKADVRRERYVGTVHCLRTPTETFMVRRHGTTWWSGNSPKLLLIVDEAGGIGRNVGNSTRNLLTGDARMLAIGNPATDDEQSWFEGASEDGYDPDRKDTVTIPIAATDSPAMTGEDAGVCADCPRSVPAHSLAIHLVDDVWVKDAIREHGADSPYVIAKVTAKFPKGGGARAIPASFVDAGMEQASPDFDDEDLIVDGTPSVDALGHPYATQPNRGAWIRLGVDVAADGGDEFVIARAEGSIARIRLVQSGAVNNNSVDVAGKILEEIRLAVILANAIGTDLKVHPVTVKIDAIGVGWGVASTLEAWVREGIVPAGVTIVRVVVSELPDKPDDVKSQWRPKNKRAELWLNGRQLLTPDPSGMVALRLDVDHKVAAQLRAPKYGTDASGRQFIEKKVDIVARLGTAQGKSPDRAEALLLSFYEPRFRKKVRILA